MSTTLFHPQMMALDAARIAHEAGGRLVWRSDRQRNQAIRHTGKAAEAVESEDYNTALQEMRAARAVFEGTRHA